MKHVLRRILSFSALLGTACSGGDVQPVALDGGAQLVSVAAQELVVRLEAFDGTPKWSLRPEPLNIRYCFTDLVPGSTQGYMQLGMLQWERVADVRFIHVGSVDGVGCTTALVPATVNFIVTMNSPNEHGISRGPFPAQPNSEQILKVQPEGLDWASRDTATHEIGHVLGFAHEWLNTGAPVNCGADPNPAEPLTEYDEDSVMMYPLPLCNGNPWPLSYLDGVGARIAYGSPATWYASTLW